MVSQHTRVAGTRLLPRCVSEPADKATVIDLGSAERRTNIAIFNCRSQTLANTETPVSSLAVPSLHSVQFHFRHGKFRYKQEGCWNRLQTEQA